MTTAAEAADQAPATAQERKFHVWCDGRRIAHFFLDAPLDDAAKTIVDQIMARYVTSVGRVGWVVADPSHLVVFTPDLHHDGLFQVIEEGGHWLDIAEFAAMTGTSDRSYLQ